MATFPRVLKKEIRAEIKVRRDIDVDVTHDNLVDLGNDMPIRVRPKTLAAQLGQEPIHRVPCALIDLRVVTGDHDVFANSFQDDSFGIRIGLCDVHSDGASRSRTNQYADPICWHFGDC